MKPYIVMMPEGWNYSMCRQCALNGLNNIKECGIEFVKCPLVYAKEAFEITERVMNWKVDVKTKGDGSVKTLDATFGGNPVSLYATKKDKK